MIDSDHVVDKTAAYALHALPQEEARAVELHCARCPECQADLAEMIGLAATLPLACEAVSPSADLKRRILDEARADASAGRRLRSAAWHAANPAFGWAAAAAAMFVVAAGLGAGAFIDHQRMAAQMQTMHTQVAAAQATIDDIAGAARVWDMSGGTRDHWWHCTLVQPLHQRPAMLMAQMPSAPEGMTYQAWVIRKGAVHNAGVVAPGMKSTVHLPMAVSKGDVIAFTVEPAGGSLRPTGPVAMQQTLD